MWQVKYSLPRSSEPVKVDSQWLQKSTKQLPQSQRTQPIKIGTTESIRKGINKGCVTNVTASSVLPYSLGIDKGFPIQDLLSGKLLIPTFLSRHKTEGGKTATNPAENVAAGCSRNEKEKHRPGLQH